MHTPAIQKTTLTLPSIAVLLDGHMAKQDTETLGARIARLRREKGLTQSELAEALKVSQPVISDATLIRRCPLQTEFLVLEPVAQALPKLGQVGQWLNVSTIDGVQGYVAAWYVSLRP